MAFRGPWIHWKWLKTNNLEKMEWNWRQYYHTPIESRFLLILRFVVCSVLLPFFHSISQKRFSFFFLSTSSVSFNENTKSKLDYNIFCSVYLLSHFWRNEANIRRIKGRWIWQLAFMWVFHSIPFVVWCCLYAHKRIVNVRFSGFVLLLSIVLNGFTHGLQSSTYLE